VENAPLPNVRRIHATLAALRSIAAVNFTGPAMILLGAPSVARPNSPLDDVSGRCRRTHDVAARGGSANSADM